MRFLYIISLCFFMSFLASCGCTHYTIRWNRLRPSYHLLNKGISEIRDTAAPGFSYSDIFKAYLSDSVFVLSSDTSNSRKNFRFSGKNPHFKCELYVTGKLIGPIAIENFLKPNRKYIIPFLSRMHCPPEHIYFKTNKKGRIRKR